MPAPRDEKEKWGEKYGKVRSDRTAAEASWRSSRVAGPESPAWSVNTRRITSCRGCHDRPEAWPCSAHEAHQDGSGGAIGSTAVASMHLAGGIARGACKRPGLCIVTGGSGPPT